MIYQEFLESDPNRIQAAIIRDVSGSVTDVDDVFFAPEDLVPGSLITVRDSIQLAKLAQRMGLVDELTVEEVMTEIDARL